MCGYFPYEIAWYHTTYKIQVNKYASVSVIRYVRIRLTTGVYSNEKWEAKKKDQLETLKKSFSHCNILYTYNNYI